ncbi:hypothetical protein QG37_05292 [Candidozyma auris]|uniref:Uncharacterized protein n=1 Tax=Candidozyma auris TaxID=498019 RepID=A0A0L0NV77_CANAR|nr:hypothetical protein QG37_05292 [[Candida] auris]
MIFFTWTIPSELKLSPNPCQITTASGFVKFEGGPQEISAVEELSTNEGVIAIGAWMLPSPDPRYETIKFGKLIHISCYVVVKKKKKKKTFLPSTPFDLEY